MAYTTNQIYDKIYERANTIYDIFKGFFGEDHVDLQTPFSDLVLKLGIERFLDHNNIPLSDPGNFDVEHPEVTDSMVCELQSKYASDKVTIYVWWSDVTITNENDRSTQIQDLYAKIEVQFDGRIPMENHGFLLNRATYTKVQFLNNYMHSHVRDIPKKIFSQFQPPCLGDGPIKGTILSLKNDYDEAFWLLFCQELSMYVTVESINGVPYHYLEHISISKSPSSDYIGYNFSSANIRTFQAVFYTSKLKDFIKYYLQHGHLSLSYINQKFTCSMPYKEFIIDISNTFIDYYNQYLATTTNDQLLECYEGGLLNNVVLTNGRFYRETGNTSPVSLNCYRGKFVLNFKGKEIRTSIIDGDSNNDNHFITVIDNRVAMFILKNILRTINYRYKNEHINTAERNQAPATPHQRVIYI